MGCAQEHITKTLKSALVQIYKGAANEISDQSYKSIIMWQEAKRFQDIKAKIQMITFNNISSDKIEKHHCATSFANTNEKYRRTTKHETGHNSILI